MNIEKKEKKKKNHCKSLYLRFLRAVAYTAQLRVSG